MSLSLRQQKVLAIVPKVTGFISLVGSAAIVYTVIRDKKKRSRTYHRLLFGISCVDISSSFWLGLSTWPIPSETGIFGAVGNQKTCALQGFFTQFGITSSFYNASLSLYYLLVIRYSWTDTSIRRIEPFLHGVPLFWGLATAIAGLPLTLFNSANLWCWIAEYPAAGRGKNADIFRWAFFYAPLWLMILIVTANCALVWWNVRAVEITAEQRRAVETQFGVSAYIAQSSYPSRHGRQESVQLQSVDELSTDSVSDLAAAIESGPDTDDDAVMASRRNHPVEEEMMEVENASEASRSLSALGRKGSNNAGRKLARSKKPAKKVSILFSTKRTKQVASQCFWYAAAFYMNWIALSVGNLFGVTVNIFD